MPQVGLGLEGLPANLTAHILLRLVDRILMPQQAARRGEYRTANVARPIALEAGLDAAMHLEHVEAHVALVLVVLITLVALVASRIAGMS